MPEVECWGNVTQEPTKEPEAWFDLKVNTHVYIDGLPEDATIEEVCTETMQLCCRFGYTCLMFILNQGCHLGPHSWLI
jgi:hypothetical protein